MPRSLMEAMSMGLPVVTTDVAGCRDAVENGRSGLIVPPGDASALTAAIARLLGDEMLRHGVGRNARERVIERYSLERIAALSAAHYRRLLKEKFGERYTPGNGFEIR
jgi:glycosyltransferase involved in cell wall biosynthesis